MRAHTGIRAVQPLMAGIMAIMVAAALTLPAPVQAQPGGNDIREMQEDLRGLLAQGEYQQLIDEADDLLAIDPGNPTATMLRALAERRIARGDLDPPTAGPGLIRTRGGPAEREAAQEATEAMIEPQPPLEPRRPATTTTMLGNLLADYRQEIIIGAAVLLALLVLLFVWIWRRSQSEPAPAAAGSGSRTGVPLSDMPTQVQRPADRKTQVTRRSTRELRKPKKKAEEPKEPQPEPEQEQQQAATPPPKEPEPKEEKPQERPAGPPPSDSLVIDDYMQKEEDEKKGEDIGSSLGIDYSETEELKTEGLKPESPDKEEKDEDEKTYHSLMFGEEEEKKKEKPETDKEELSKSQSDDQFANMMFGSGADETVKAEPGETKPPPDDDPDRTKLTPPSEGEAKSEQKTSMFDRQRQTGKEALESGDYARAVQCLSVAASLRPGDQEVRELLDEARKKRRAG